MELDAKQQLVDANIWIAYFDKNDSLTTQGRALLKQAHDEQHHIIVTDFVLQEVVTIFLYRRTIEHLKQFLNYIDTQPHIEVIGIDSLLWQRVVRFMTVHQHQPKLSFTDWTLLYLAHRFDFSLVTFDRQLNNSYHRFTQLDKVRSFD